MPLMTDEQLLELPFSKLKDTHFQGVVQSLFSNHSREWIGKNVAGCHPTSRRPRARNFLKGFLLRKLRLRSNELSHKGLPEKRNQGKFQELPLEIILEILKHAHPLDLYHLSKSSRRLHESLRSPTSALVWGSSFEIHKDDVPGPPSRLKSRPAAWAQFLFGPTICEMCGDSWADLDITFIQKLCQACRKIKMMTETQVYALCAERSDGSMSDYESDGGTSMVYWENKVIQLCQESLWLSVNAVRSHSWRISNYKYRKAEVHEALCLLFGTAKGGGTFPMDSAITARRGGIEVLRKHVDLHYSWIDGGLSEMRDFERGWYKSRFSKYYRRIGYEEADLEDVRFEPSVYLKDHVLHGLSKRRDVRYRFAKIESAVCERRAKRIQNESRDALLTIYKRHKASRPAIEWKHFPFQSLLFNATPLFTSLFETLTSGDPRFILPDFPESLVADNISNAVSTWRTRFRQDLLDLIPESIKTKCEANQGRAFCEEMIHLPMMVFTCRCSTVASATSCCGWDDVLSHRCVCTGSLGIRWSERGSLAVEAILERLELDPWATTTQDLDNINARFFCGTESSSLAPNRGGDSFRRALTWRECVQHFIVGASYCRPPPSAYPLWLLLTPNAANFVYSREHQWPRFKHRVWACTHCDEHMDEQQSYHNVKQHLKERHGITLVPTLKQPLPHPWRDDIIHLPQVSYQDGPRSPVFYQVDPPFLSCILCETADGPKITMFQDKLREHFSQVHGMSEEVENRDWEIVPAYYAY